MHVHALPNPIRDATLLHMMRRLLKHLRVAALLAAPLLGLSTAPPAFALTETTWTPIVPPGWDKVVPFDLLGTGDFGFRASQVDGYMEAGGDFDGDGRPDRAEVYLNRHTGKHAVFITLNARAVARVYKVIEAPANLLVRIGISRAVPGEYRNACASGKTCTPATFTTKHDGLAYFTFESAAQVVYWDGRGFVDERVGD
ncbi:MAG: hypothetical protein K2P94_08280 [Rhodospirillaceae bacterium]|nr:hypothetical protein [Rhodospirillaceae bacterium]